MATTTNYSWTTPDDTGLVKDGAAAIRTLGSSVDTTVKNLNPETTLGDIAYRSSTANVKTRLGLGTAGQVLAVNSGATAPEWKTLATGGMTLINTGGTTLTGASVSVTSIPGTYNYLYGVVRDFKPANDTQHFRMRFNNDTGANRHLYQASLAAQSDVGLNQSFNDTALYISATADNSVATNLIIFEVYDYANTTTWKFTNSRAITVNSATNTNVNYMTTVGIYNQTGAITELNFFPTSGNFTSGTLYLYGVK